MKRNNKNSIDLEVLRQKEEAALKKRLLVGENIRLTRESLDLTREKLAEKSGVADSTVKRAELGISTLRSDNLANIAHALGVKIDELFNERPEEEGRK